MNLSRRTLSARALRRLVVPALLIAGAFVAPTAASAAVTLSNDDGVITINGDDGADIVHLLFQGADFKIQVIDGAADPLAGCTLEPGPGFVYHVCPGITAVKAHLGGGNDAMNNRAPGVDVEIHGGDGDDYLESTMMGGDVRATIYGDAGDDHLFGGRLGDRLDGGSGVDAIFGNEGDDVIFSRDGEADAYVNCGDGMDLADSDPEDNPSWCEGEPDMVAPDLTIDAPSGTVNTRVNTIELSSTDPTATFECKLDDGAWGVCAASYLTPALDDGEHTISARAKERRRRG